MSDAFQCDFCGEYKSGEPEQSLYVKEHYKGSSSPNYYETYHLCEQCHATLEDEGIDE